MTTSPTILLVDDNDLFREMLRGLLGLKYPSLRVFEAANGLEAVELATLHVPDVVILDLNMPIMDGYHAAILMRGNPKTSAIPLVLMTSEDADHESVQQLRTRCQGFLAKPFSFKDLEQLLNRLTLLQPEQIRRRHAPAQRSLVARAHSL